MHLISRVFFAVAFLLGLSSSIGARESDERPITVRYRLGSSLQKRLLRSTRIRPWHGVANLRPYYEAIGMTFRPDTFAILNVRSHVLTVRNDEANRSLVPLFFQEDFQVTPHRLTTRSSEQAGR